MGVRWSLAAGLVAAAGCQGLPDVKALQSNLDMMTELGFAKEHVAVDKYLDLSLVKEAASRMN